ncbi:GDP-mannose 4,6-dehydratase [Paenibacillus gorillae]|uniref:GDP-mannose 4,6-dehydratase n=1 Tax=Paenibacillus gorillae TaxID=1243662 RepID=UPI0004B7F291|nr:GDP-mannose 4,6-dehydratase [Paenibacillus gorillae]
MRALITGISGFVGRYLAQNLINNGYEVWGGTRKCPPPLITSVNIIDIDFSQQDRVQRVLEDIRPDVIFHLSGQSSVKYSWDNIEETFQSNLMDTIGLFEAIRKSTVSDLVKVISIGSSEEYGLVTKLPIIEENNTNPLNPYGLSKASVSRLAQHYSKQYGLQIIHARAFNHIGPGQMLGFVTSDFAKQIVEIEHGKADPVIYVGNLTSKRDFTDVRDIVEGYRLLFEQGVSGQVYNVCSGLCVSIRSILDQLILFSSTTIEVIIDENKMRPSDVPEYYGSNKKINQATGWTPAIPLEKSLYDIYQYWKKST